MSHPHYEFIRAHYGAKAFTCAELKHDLRAQGIIEAQQILWHYLDNLVQRGVLIRTREEKRTMYRLVEAAVS